MAIPVICVVKPDCPANRQQAVLVAATKGGPLLSGEEMVFRKPSQKLLRQATALAHAEKLLEAEEIPTPCRQLCLGKLVAPCGQYENSLFH